MNDYCVICGKEIMTESGHVCRLCANSSQRGGTTTNLLGLLAGGAVVAAVIIAASSSTPEALPLLTMEQQPGYARLVINTDGNFRVSGSYDNIHWTVIETNWDTLSMGRTMAIEHRWTEAAYFKAEPL